MNNQKLPRAGRKTVLCTALILSGLLITLFALPTDSSVEIFRFAAISFGVVLAVATAVEVCSEVRALMRVDVLMLWALYGLTLFEFLFPQPLVDGIVSADAATSGVYAVFLGFGGIAIGRHLISKANQLGPSPHAGPFPTNHIFFFFLAAALVGYLHVLIAVNFDIFEVLRQVQLPRFSQSWSRGRYGDGSSLLYELGMLINLLPPLAGLIYARRDDFWLYQKIVVAVVLLFVLYCTFAGGTRSVVASYVITFLGAYFLARSKVRVREVLLIGIPLLAIMFVATVYMLDFRTTGLGDFSFEGARHDTVFIDQNIVVISQLIQVFPGSGDFLGFEIPFNALIRPIPRVLWPGKPEGLSTSIEAALGGGPGMTISCTFVGEAYMAGGFLGILLIALFFGAAAEVWNRVGRDVGSPIRQLLYASGLLCAAFAMRSMLGMVPPMLPTIALGLWARYMLPRESQRAVRGGV